jgi:Protein of unknown function DUF115
VKKILLFTDSRGVHKPAGSKHSLYADRLAKHADLAVTSYLCPYQWTTIPDFLALAETLDLAAFDHVILHAGIVDHSPRPVSQMMEKLYEPAVETDAKTTAALLSSRKFTQQKIVNRKKVILDSLFGAATMKSHLSRPFDDEYEGEKTINLYSLAMLVETLVPRLASIDNLIFIGANDFCPGWNGDFPKARPTNIRIIEEYSRELCRMLPNSVNLHQWTAENVREHTCDNLHLTSSGHQWIYLRLLEAMGLRGRDYQANRRSVGQPVRKTAWPLRAKAPAETLESIQFDEPQPLSALRLETLQRQVGRVGKPLATLVVGLRIQKDEPSRLENLRFLMSWLLRFYGHAFEVLIVEQDALPTANLRDELPGNFRYEFIYNPEAYNRGWLYNVTVKHFTDCPVVAFCDTDILPGSNFLDCVVDCYKDFDAVSPNRSLYYSSAEQKQRVLAAGTYADLPLTAGALKNPTSLAGGMLVVNRDKFLAIGGFEQYVGYGCEDRALDVTMLALLPPERLRMDSHAYFHLHHPSHATEHVYFSDIYSHMVANYGCEYTRGLSPVSYLHVNCCHEATGKVFALAQNRASVTGDPDMYRKYSHITINGLPPTSPGKLIKIAQAEPTFPPNFTNLEDYVEKERFLGKYAGSWAPALPKGSAPNDHEQLAFFYNRFKGKRCFIIGNGPSLNKHDLSLLQNEYTFAVNSIYYKTRETGFRPTFFVVEDSSVIKENLKEIVSYEAPFKFFPTIYRSLHPKVPGTYFFDIDRGFYEKSSPNYAIPRFSTDITKGVFCGQSVTYVNLQLAFFMGFTEVYLIGMDFDYEIPLSHKRIGDVLVSDSDDTNHFHKDYFGKGKTWKDPKLDRVLMNYKMARLVYECAGRGIFNATVGGKLEAFERISYDGLFRGLDRRFAPQELDLTQPPAAAGVAAAAKPAAANLTAAAAAAVKASSSTQPPPKPGTPASVGVPAVATPSPATSAAAKVPVSGSRNTTAALAPSVPEAHRLFAQREYAACVRFCDAMYAERGLRVFKDIADLARSRLARVQA